MNACMSEGREGEKKRANLDEIKDLLAKQMFPSDFQMFKETLENINIPVTIKEIPQKANYNNSLARVLPCAVAAISLLVRLIKVLRFGP